MIQPLGILFLVLFVATPIIYFTGSAESPFELLRSELLCVAALLAFVQWLSIDSKKSEFRIRFSTAGLLIQCLSIAMFISFLASINPYLSFWGTKPLPADSLRLTLYCTILAFVLDQVHFSFKEWKILFGSLNIVLAIQILFGLLQIYEIDPLWWFKKEEIFGTMGMTISYGTVVGMLLINSIHSFITAEKSSTLQKIYVFVLGVMLFLGPYVLLQSGSRTPILVSTAAIISFLLFFGISRQSNYKKNTIIALVLLLCGYGFFAINSQDTVLAKKMSNSMFSHALGVRQQAADFAIKSWKQSPIIGNGPETFLITQGKFQTAKLNHSNWRLEWSKVHNSILHYLSNTGLVGTFFFTALFLYMMFIGTKLFFSNDRSEKSVLAFTAGVAYCLIFIANITCFNMVYTQFLSVVFPLASSQLLNSKNFSINFSLLPKVYKLLRALTLAGIVALTYFSTTYWYSDIIYQEGRRLRESLKDSKSSYDYYERAINIFPYEAYNYCGAAHALNDLLARNYLNLDTFEKIRTEGIIDSYVNDCVDRVGNRQHGIFLAAKVYLVQIDSKYSNDPKKALDLLYKALEITPQHPEIHFRIGLMHAVKGEYDKFEQSMRTSIENKIDYIPAYIRLAEYYFINKRTSDAQSVIADALKVEFVVNDFIPTLLGLAEIAKAHNDQNGYELIVKKFEFENKRIPQKGTFLPAGTY